MRAFNTCVVCAVLSAGFLYMTFSNETEYVSMHKSDTVDVSGSRDYEREANARKKVDQIFNSEGDIVGEIPPCSEVNTMPCTAVAPDDPIREELEATSKSGLFKKGQNVTCIYPAIAYEWHDLDNQIVKNVGAKCTVTDASDVWNDIEPGYQHVKVNCEKDLRTRAQTDHIADSELNKGERWMFSNNCYHF